ncbi:hypothetical protein P7C71_g6613, partial [Lecanoromycetidae sp. Uapishka_2]
LLQSPFLSRIGGPAHVREGLSEAFEQGAAVTAKVTWLPQGRSGEDADADSRPSSRRGGGGAFAESQQRTRYISCTPLLGSDDQVGVWMVVMVENELVTGSLASRTAALNRYDQPVPPTPSEYQRESTSIDSNDGNGAERGGGARFERSMSGHVRGGRGKQTGSEGGRLYAEFMRNGGVGGGEGSEGAGGGAQGVERTPLDFGGGGGDYLNNGAHGGLNGNGVVNGESRFEEVRSP